jgi:hypothetical protein
MQIRVNNSRDFLKPLKIADGSPAKFHCDHDAKSLKQKSLECSSRLREVDGEFMHTRALGRRASDAWS